METVAILPAYNLEYSIASIIKRTKNFVNLIIVVSDGSKDNTNLMAEKAGAVCPQHTNIRGKGFAVRKGIELSKKYNPKYVILMDSDGQHMPEEIPNLRESIQNGDFDMIVGSRMKGKLKTSNINKLGNFLLKIISFLVTGKWFTDTESGFRLFKASKLYSLDLNANFFEIESELLLKSLYNGFKVGEVPITIPKAVPGIRFLDGLKIGFHKMKLGLILKLKGLFLC